MSLGDERPRALGRRRQRASRSGSWPMRSAGADARALAHETGQIARDQPRRLHHAEASRSPAMVQAIALFSSRSPCQGGREEGRMVDRSCARSCPQSGCGSQWRAVDTPHEDSTRVAAPAAQAPGSRRRHRCLTTIAAHPPRREQTRSRRDRRSPARGISGKKIDAQERPPASRANRAGTHSQNNSQVTTWRTRDDGQPSRWTGESWGERMELGEPKVHSAASGVDRRPWRGLVERQIASSPRGVAVGGGDFVSRPATVFSAPPRLALPVPTFGWQ